MKRDIHKNMKGLRLCTLKVIKIYKVLFDMYYYLYFIIINPLKNSVYIFIYEIPLLLKKA